MSPHEAAREQRAGVADDDVVALLPLVRRVVRARVADPSTAEDLVQEVVSQVLAASGRVRPGMLEPYAIATARNLAAKAWEGRDRQRRNLHRVVDLRSVPQPDEGLLAAEERAALTEALTRLSDSERDAILSHEVRGEPTSALAAERNSTPGAVAAQLNRARARLRVEYLLAVEQAEPLSDRCRPVLMALSSGERRRQQELDVSQHLLTCELCAGLSEALLARGRQPDNELKVSINGNPDVVAARQRVREAAESLGFSSTELTMLATAVSEIARNMVRFAGGGELTLTKLDRPRSGIRVVARDAGPGIADVEEALQHGFTTYRGLGLGLPGARRLMDEFDVESKMGHGTTVTMTKWSRGR